MPSEKVYFSKGSVQVMWSHPRRRHPTPGREGLSAEKRRGNHLCYSVSLNFKSRTSARRTPSKDIASQPDFMLLLLLLSQWCLEAQGPANRGGASRLEPRRQLPQKQPSVPEAQNLKFNRGRGMNLILGTNKNLFLLMQMPVSGYRLP